MDKETLTRREIDVIRQKDSSIYNIKRYENSLCMQYLLASKYDILDVQKLSKLTFGFYHPFVLKRAAQPFKRYDGHEKYYLDNYEDSSMEANIFDVLKTRKSTKKYEPYNISLKELYYILRYSYGINRKESINGGVTWKFRPVPSGGGLFASELYVVTINSQIPKGLYHYSPDDNSLEVVKYGDFLKVMQEHSGADPYIDSENVSCIIFTTTFIDRLYIKYGERGYRFMLLEVGFLGQTISLLAEALNLGSCMLGGYHDSNIEEFLGIDGQLESVQNTIVIGKRKDE